jgi:hypothetical protein
MFDSGVAYELRRKEVKAGVPCCGTLEAGQGGGALDHPSGSLIVSVDLSGGRFYCYGCVRFPERGSKGNGV